MEHTEKSFLIEDTDLFIVAQLLKERVLKKISNETIFLILGRQQRLIAKEFICVFSKLF